MILQILFAVGAIYCAAVVGKFLWQERGCFKAVFDQIKEEILITKK